MYPPAIVEAGLLALLLCASAIALAFVIADLRTAKELEDALTADPISLDGMNPEQVMYLLKIGLIDQGRAIAAIQDYNRRGET